MSKININIESSRNETNSALPNARNSINTIASGIRLQRSGIYHAVLSRNGINDQFNSVNGSLSDISAKIQLFYTELNRYLDKYSSAEDNIVRNASGTKNLSGILDNNAQFGHTETDGDRDKKEIKRLINSIVSLITGVAHGEEDTRNVRDKLNDILGLFSDILSFIDDKADNPFAEKSGGILEYFNSLVEFANNHLDGENPFANLAGLSAASVKVIGNTIKWIGDEGEKDVSNELGIVSAFLSIFEKFIKAGDGTVPDFLMDAGDIISSGSKLAEKLYDYGVDTSKFNFADKFERTKVLAPIISLATMATRLVGNVAQKTMDDGKYDIDDYGQTLLDTGLAGLTSLVKGFSFNLIDIDPSRATNIFNENISATTDWINSKGDEVGAPLWGKVVGTVCSVPFVALWSTGELFVDYGMQIGNGIMALIN
ncbi:MAG: hypothetical protein IJL87_08850 [Clostridia bacterium]|nr:hypothetical protein [Clostridia bacterium]